MNFDCLLILSRAPPPPPPMKIILTLFYFYKEKSLGCPLLNANKQIHLHRKEKNIYGLFYNINELYYKKKKKKYKIM